MITNKFQFLMASTNRIHTQCVLIKHLTKIIQLKHLRSSPTGPALHCAGGSLLSSNSSCQLTKKKSTRNSKMHVHQSWFNYIISVKLGLQIFQVQYNYSVPKAFN